MWTTHRFSPVLLNVMHRYFYLLRKYSGSPNNLVYAILEAGSGSQHEENESQKPVPLEELLRGLREQNEYQ